MCSCSLLSEECSFCIECHPSVVTWRWLEGAPACVWYPPWLGRSVWQVQPMKCCLTAGCCIDTHCVTDCYIVRDSVVIKVREINFQMLAFKTVLSLRFGFLWQWRKDYNLLWCGTVQLGGKAPTSVGTCFVYLQDSVAFQKISLYCLSWFCSICWIKNKCFWFYGI